VPHDHDRHLERGDALGHDRSHGEIRERALAMGTHHHEVDGVLLHVGRELRRDFADAPRGVVSDARLVQLAFRQRERGFAFLALVVVDRALAGDGLGARIGDRGLHVHDVHFRRLGEPGEVVDQVARGNLGVGRAVRRKQDVHGWVSFRSGDLEPVGDGWAHSASVKPVGAAVAWGLHEIIVVAPAAIRQRVAGIVPATSRYAKGAIAI
jgi:hypothetical protein